jgi:hypothetical protein
MPKTAMWILALLTIAVATLCVVEYQRTRDIPGFIPDKPVGKLTPVPPSGFTPVNETPVIGRYQIVNPSPSFRGEIRLLDTVTGDSWISCSGQDGYHWCVTPKTDDHTAGEKSK